MRANTEDDDRMIALVLSEEYAKLDGAFGNGHFSVPNVNSDHQRLIERLKVCGLQEVKVSGDGNCQFRAISEQIYESPKHHKHVRKEIVKQLKRHRSMYGCYVPMRYKRYCKRMARFGEWGDHVTLQAAADMFEAKICVLTSFRDSSFIQVMPSQQLQEPKRELWLSFSSGDHYNSLRLVRDAPIKHKPRKKFWFF